MAGARVTATFDDAAMQDALRRMQGALHRALPGIAQGLERNTVRRFDAARDPQGQPWAALHPAYAAIKKGPGILREAGMRGGL